MPDHDLPSTRRPSRPHQPLTAAARVRGGGRGPTHHPPAVLGRGGVSLYVFPNERTRPPMSDEGTTRPAMQHLRPRPQGEAPFRPSRPPFSA